MLFEVSIVRGQWTVHSCRPLIPDNGALVRQYPLHIIFGWASAERIQYTCMSIFLVSRISACCLSPHTCLNIKHDCPLHHEATGFSQGSVKIYSQRYETCLGKLIYHNKQLNALSCESKSNTSASRVKALIETCQCLKSLRPHCFVYKKWSQ